MTESGKKREDSRNTLSRREAVSRILLLSGGAFAALTAYEWFTFKKSKPDLRYLEEQKELLASLAETVIPRTDTPGAQDTNIVPIMIMLIRECTSVESQSSFIQGLRDIQSFCKGQYQREFPHCTAEEKNHALVRFESRGILPRVLPHFEPHGLLARAVSRLPAAAAQYLFDAHFFDTLKQVVAIGYCTSELGATRGLAYDPIPGKYVGCVPMALGQKAWAIEL
jgi:hypothetical protein